MEEEKNGIDFVECPYCGKKTKQITEAHLKTHNKTFKIFKEDFPNMIFRCEKLSKTCIENQIRVQYNNEKNSCKICGETIKWNQTFCSTNCAAEFKKVPIVSENCEFCGEPFYTKINSKNSFCSRDCYDLFRKDKKLENKNNYRDKIRNKYSNQCIICNSFDSLRIHHIDTNHRNNSEDNLILLCEKCHRMIHSGPKILIYKKINIYVDYELEYAKNGNIQLEIGINDRLNFNNSSTINFEEILKILKFLIDEKLEKIKPSAEFIVFYLFIMLRRYNINISVVRVFTENNTIEYKGGDVDVLYNKNLYISNGTQTE